MTKEYLFQQYLESAKDAFRSVWSPERISDETRDRYLTDEMADFMKSRFDSDYSAYKRGEITEKILTVGAGRSAGYCAGLMYDGPVE